MNGTIESSAVGRIVVPPDVPRGFDIFYTTADFEGPLDALAALVRERSGAKLATCNQVHGTAVHRAGSAGECDALWSAEPQTALGIKVADCLPVTIVDPVHGVMANIHSGWRGAVQRITAVTLDTLERESPFAARDAIAWLGPTIRACCFEVGEEVVEQFHSAYETAPDFIDRSRTKAHVDVVGLTTDLLKRRGIGRVVDVGICTKCGRGVAESRGGETSRPRNPATSQPLFHSFRREPKRGGRNLAIVAR